MSPLSVPKREPGQLQRDGEGSAFGNEAAGVNSGFAWPRATGFTAWGLHGLGCKAQTKIPPASCGVVRRINYRGQA